MSSNKTTWKFIGCWINCFSNLQLINLIYMTTLSSIINKSLTILSYLLITIFILGNNIEARCQDKTKISIGIGIPELINVGARLQLNQLELGLNIGTLPSDHQSVMSYMLEGRYHFGGNSELTDQKPWFGRLGLNYHRFENEAMIDENFYLHLRVGRDYNLSKRFGLELDFGGIFLLHNAQIEKKPTSSWGVGFDSPILPSLGFAIFYRI